MTPLWRLFGRFKRFCIASRQYNNHGKEVRLQYKVT